MLLVADYWEGRVIKHLGTVKRLWQWQYLGGFASRGARPIKVGGPS